MIEVSHLALWVYEHYETVTPVHSVKNVVAQRSNDSSGLVRPSGVSAKSVRAIGQRGTSASYESWKRKHPRSEIVWGAAMPDEPRKPNYWVIDQGPSPGEEVLSKRAQWLEADRDEDRKVIAQARGALDRDGHRAVGTWCDHGEIPLQRTDCSGCTTLAALDRLLGKK